MHAGPIGIFDSGLGGTSTLRQLIRLLPNENYYYYGDCANAPYGVRTEANIAELTLAAGRRIQQAGAKLLVIACNTATAAALPVLTEALPIPVLGIRPAIVSASAAPGSGKILMIATEATTKLPAYRALHASLADPARVIDVPGPADIVRSVEAGVRDQSHYVKILETAFAPYDGMAIDGIVLGCTHYPFMEEAVRAYAAAHFTGACRIFEGGAETCRRVLEAMTERDLFHPDGTGEVSFHCSGGPGMQEKQEQRFRALLTDHPQP